MTPDDHPLRQFTEFCNVGKLTNMNDKVSQHGFLPAWLVRNLEQADIYLAELYEENAMEMKSFCTPHQIEEILKFASYIPRFETEVQALPITRSILKIFMTIEPNFEWSDRWNGKYE
jgi:hypothetical protein